MKFNKWTLGLAAVGVVSLASAVKAEEKASSVMTALSSTTISGYVNTSAQWYLGNANTGIPGRAFDGPAGKQDGFNLDVVSLTVSKPVSEGDWGAGYVAQMWMGPDAAGFNTSFPNAAGAGGDFAVKQAFVDLHAPIGNGLDIKLGHFNYIGGYEMPDAGDNPNYSRSYAWTMEPASHTGLLLSYKVCDALSLMAGVANSYNNGINWRGMRSGAAAPSQTEKTYMGQFALTAPESFGWLKGATLSSTIVNGLNNASGSGGSVLSAGHINCWQTSATVPMPVKGLSLGASYDYMNGAPLAFAAAQNKSAYVNATTLYTMYQATEKLKLNVRAEYTQATSGFWYAPTPTSKRAELFGLTGTIDYSLWKNVISRVEARWDHSLDGDKPYGGTVVTSPGPYKDAVTLAANIIYKF